jgi:copper chaperone NosL
MIMTTLRNQLMTGLVALLLSGCGGGEVRPVEIYPDDLCAACRMAVSDERFASEIITADGDVFKFDDLGCLWKFRKGEAGSHPAAIFVKDFETKEWVPYARAAIVTADVATPMASGMVAFADTARARAFTAKHPAVVVGGDACCGAGHRDEM